MTMIVNERFARSREPFAAQIDYLDPFSEGADMLLRAMKDEFGAPVAAAGTDRSATLSARRGMAADPDVSALRDCLQAAAARFGDPLVSTVVCIKPSGRPAFAAWPCTIDPETEPDMRRLAIAAVLTPLFVGAAPASADKPAAKDEEAILQCLAKLDTKGRLVCK